MLEIKENIMSKTGKRLFLLDIEVFEKIEEIMESFGLGKYMEEAEEDETLSLEEAKEYYSRLKDS